MIKINLLPTTKKKPPRKITELQQQLILASLVLILVFVGMFLYYNRMQTKIDILTKTKAENEAKVEAQKKMLKAVESVGEERKKVTGKIDIIEQLKKNQVILVHLLDDVSRALPPGVNITTMAEKEGKIDMEGTAFTNNDIVKFIDNLKACKSCSDVFLLETVQTNLDGTDVYKYKLQFLFKGV